MTQTELVEHLARTMEWSQAETHSTLKALIGDWTDRLDRGESFTIPGLGTFRSEIQDTRVRYSPHHDQKLLLPPRSQVKFSPARSLKEALNPEDTSGSS